MPARPAPDETLVFGEEPKSAGRRRVVRRVLLGLLALAVVGFAWLWFAPCGFGGCAPVSELESFQTEGSELLDINGRPFATLASADRRVVPLDSLPLYLPRAFIAVEDRRFYEHGGVDWKRVLGALRSNVRARGVAEGGSTISMQLARNLFPEHLPYRERSIRRKLMEIRVARQIERAFTKDKILELYLNHIYLGEGAYGVDAAAREYFGKPASRLTLAEAAVLGGLPKAPSQINPRENRRAARERRDLVLREMAKAGFITPEEAEETVARPIRLARRAGTGRAERGAYFKAQVRRELAERAGERVYTTGLRVYTTYDPRAQRAAEEELARQLDAVEAGQFGAYRHPTYPENRGENEEGTTPYLQGAVIVMEARTGEVRALVGGRDYEDSKFDRATQAVRQPGSAFKPFVYLAALQRGMAPTYRLEDAPLRITMAGGEVWEPRNYTGRYDGPLTLREALTRSKNTVTVRLAQEVGMEPVIETARELGIDSPISGNLATALGASEVRPLELTRAYAPLANLGEAVESRFIRRVETRDGDVLWEAEEVSGDEVVDPAAAFVLTTMLQDVVNRGTGSPARAAGYRGPAAGKTGTTNGATDVWFVGYTPELVGVVWMGLDQPRTIVRGASGGTIAAPVWGRIMQRIYAGRPTPGSWSPPSGVVTEQVDRVTGLAVDASCPAQGPTYTEYFVNSVPARQVCIPAPAYPSLAGGDSLWVDEEWDMEADTSLGGEVAPGIDWPELEERRRRERERTTDDGEPLPPGTPPGTVNPTNPSAPRPAPSRRPPSTREARPPVADTSARPVPPPEEEEEPPRTVGTPVRPGQRATPPDTARRP
ncbi:MAG TPA: PBP1A family penicillin-binding protein [Longimicrobiaceae bacterium]|nr:PBP1A family penicillin-binding protein [Longimicrobiaceae bacterium]